MGEELSRIIREQTGILFSNIQETFNSVKEAQMDDIVCEWPLWKHFYHMLHSLDQWFINPYNYIEPDFHEENMNSLHEPSANSLSKSELIQYYAEIKMKIDNYLEELKDELLSSCPENCKYTRLTLILAQYRHLMYHIGFIHSCILHNTGSWPEFIGISRPIKGNINNEMM